MCIWVYIYIYIYIYICVYTYITHQHTSMATMVGATDSNETIIINIINIINMIRRGDIIGMIMIVTIMFANIMCV